MHKVQSKYRQVLVLLIVSTSLVELVSSKRLNFKESLTAYAETDDDDSHNQDNNPTKYFHSRNAAKSNFAVHGFQTGSVKGSRKKENGSERKELGSTIGFGTLEALAAKRRANNPNEPNISLLKTTKTGTNVSNGPSRKEITTQKPFSLWEITKNMLLSLQQKGSRRFTANNMSTVPGIESGSAKNNSESVNSDDVTSAASATGTSSNSCCSQSRNKVSSSHSHHIPTKLSQTKEIPKQQAWDNFRTTMKNERGNKMGISYNSNKNNGVSNNTLNATKLHHLKDLEENENNRKKKEVGNNGGLRDLMWNTAKALWSVNKVHFLPTFLHTKTGGKLSLIRDSIFKPITILSQFKTGVQEINNEKWRNLARLTSAGSGWSSNPAPEVFVVKVQPHNYQLFTIAKYLLRLTKHTVVTKWKLKRALADLQLRALRKFIRVIMNKNISQKIAKIKILTNAAWNGKLAFLRILAGDFGRNKTEVYYSGKDNSINVDLTYSSLQNNNKNNYYRNNGWPGRFSLSQTYLPPPPLSPSPLPPRDSYHPLSPSPPPVLHTNYYHNPENTPSIPLLPPPLLSPSTSYEAPSSEQLIETPSYAGLLNIMGINPSNFHYNKYNYSKDRSTTSTTTKAPNYISYYPSVTSSPPYSSNNEHSSIPSTSFQPPSPPHHHYKIPIIEKPAASYSYHFSNGPNSGQDNLRSPKNNGNQLLYQADSSSSFASYKYPSETHSNTEHDSIVTAPSSSSVATASSSLSSLLQSFKASTVSNKVITTTTASPFRLKLLDLMGASATISAEEETIS